MSEVPLYRRHTFNNVSSLAAARDWQRPLEISGTVCYLRHANVEDKVILGIDMLF